MVSVDREAQEGDREAIMDSNTESEGDSQASRQAKFQENVIGLLAVGQDHTQGEEAVTFLEAQLILRAARNPNMVPTRQPDGTLVWREEPYLRFHLSPDFPEPTGIGVLVPRSLETGRVK
jgi:hypothetical protein